MNFPLQSYWKLSAFIIIILSGCRIIAAWYLPLMPDEAYYWLWSQHLSLGYLDHPPAIAFLIALNQKLFTLLNLDIHHPLAIRGGAILLASCWSLGFAQLLSKMYANKTEMKTLLLMGLLQFASFAAGLFATPDALLATCWIFAFIAATQFSQSYVAAIRLGFWIGLGMWSKYTMAFMPMALVLWTIKSKQPQNIKKLLLIGSVSIAVFTPHAYWQYQHGWLTIKAQGAHALQGQVHTDRTNTDTDYLASNPDMPSREFLMMSRLFSPTPEPSRKPHHPIQKSLSRMSDLIGSQLGLLGCISIVLIYGLARQYKSNQYFTWQAEQRPMHAHEWITVFPLLTCLLIATFNKIEANWPALSLITLGTIVLPVVRANDKSIHRAALLNGCVIVGLCMGLAVATDRIIQHTERLRVDSAGYEEMVRVLKQKPEPTFADTYQDTAMLQWHGLTQVFQAQGTSRASEFTLNNLFAPPAKLERFTFVSRKLYLPRYQNYTPLNFKAYFVCAENIVVSSEEASSLPPCVGLKMTYYVAEYARFNHDK